jgi:antitoxin (DNA-binding transcriptional repressor) of toxin-antitoxin stability system
VSREIVDVHGAKTRLSQLIARAERGERIVIARGAGKPVAELGPIRRSARESMPQSDPLLNVDDFAVEGPGGELTNSEIDRVLYDKA